MRKKVKKVKKTQRRELNDCCFIYALQQTGEYPDAELLKTIYYNEINNNLDFPLDYNEQSCTRIIAPIKRDIKPSKTP